MCQEASSEGLGTWWQTGKVGYHTFSESSSFPSKPGTLNSSTSPITPVQGTRPPTSFSSRLLVQNVCTGHWRSSDKGRVLGGSGSKEGIVRAVRDEGCRCGGTWHLAQTAMSQVVEVELTHPGESRDQTSESVCREIVEDKI